MKTSKWLLPFLILLLHLFCALNFNCKNKHGHLSIVVFFLSAFSPSLFFISTKYRTLPQVNVKTRLLYTSWSVALLHLTPKFSLAVLSQENKSFYFSSLFKLTLFEADQEETVLCKKLFLQTYFSICAHRVLEIMKAITVYHPKHNIFSKAIVKFTKYSELKY